jgi:hypothetical protein
MLFVKRKEEKIKNKRWAEVSYGSVLAIGGI